MRFFYLFLVFQIYLFAIILDDIYISNGISAYEKKEYKKAYESFSKVEDKSDKVFYNMANSLYKLKKYDEAIKLYKKISDKSLGHKKYHNMANSYIKLKDYEKAVEYYNKALSFKDDERTRFNLSLSEVLKKEQLEKRKKENSEVTEKICKVGSKTIWSLIEPDETNLKQDKKLEFLLRFDNISKLEFDDSKKNIYLSDGKREDDNKTVLKSKEKLKIDSYQKQKWDRRVEESSIKTLVIPMEKGVISDSKKPW